VIISLAIILVAGASVIYPKNCLFLRKLATLPSAFSGSAFSYDLARHQHFGNGGLFCLLAFLFLAQPERWPLSSVAEELAAQALLAEAEQFLAVEREEAEAEEEGEKRDFPPDEWAFAKEHQGFFDDSYDGVDAGPVGRMLHMASLAFEDRFKPLPVLAEDGHAATFGVFIDKSTPFPSYYTGRVHMMGGWAVRMAQLHLHR
jgi:hypothetical protein